MSSPFWTVKVERRLPRTPEVVGEPRPEAGWEAGRQAETLQLCSKNRLCLKVCLQGHTRGCPSHLPHLLLPSSSSRPSVNNHLGILKQSGKWGWHQCPLHGPRGTWRWGGIQVDLSRTEGRKARDNSRQLEADPQRTGAYHKNLPEHHDNRRLWDHWCRILYLHCSESPRGDYSCYHCWVFLTWQMKYNELMESSFVSMTRFGVLLTNALPEADVKCQTPPPALWVRPRHPN